MFIDNAFQSQSSLKSFHSFFFCSSSFSMQAEPGLIETRYDLSLSTAGFQMRFVGHEQINTARFSQRVHNKSTQAQCEASHLIERERHFQEHYRQWNDKFYPKMEPKLFCNFEVRYVF